MGAEQSKCKCLCLPAQSGKTRKVEELIKVHKLGELFPPVDINIIISANNRLLVEQTKTRMTNDLATDSEEGANDACIKGNVFSWMSGTKESNISAIDLAFRLIEEIDMVVICAHPTRIRYLSQTLERLDKLRLFTKRINIWIDEADNSINLWSKYESILTSSIINQVTLVSATFGTILNKYKTLSIIPYLNTHPACYRGLMHSNRNAVNYVGTASEYVKHVITTNKHLTKPGMRAFIPGSIAKTSHDDIAEFLHIEHGFVVIIINAERKEILVPGHEPIDLRCYLTVDSGEIQTEFNAQLAKLYKENNWDRYPLAITGFYCVERGVTFQCGPDVNISHNGFLFDYGIIPPIASPDSAYQAMARVFGNIGDLLNYKPAEIYTNDLTFTRVEHKEAIAINIARLVAEQGLEQVNKNDFKAAQNFEIESQFELHTEEFVTLREASNYMRDFGARGKGENAIPSDENGFIQSSTTGKKCVLNYYDVKREMNEWSKTSNFDVKKTSTETKAFGRLYICYKDITDNTSVVFIPRVLVRIET